MRTAPRPSALVRNHAIPLLLMVVGAAHGAANEVAQPRAVDMDDQGREKLEQESHRRMIAELGAIARQTQSNPYLGGAQLAEVRSLLEQRSDRKLLSELRLRYAAGKLELRLGRNDSAIDELTGALELANHRGSGAFPRLTFDMEYELALANLRAGEVGNCVGRRTARSCLLPITGDGVHVDKRGAREAARVFTRLLRRLDEDGASRDDARRLSCQWLLNIAAMTAGDHPDAVPEEYRLAPEVFVTDGECARFTDVAMEVGLDTFDLCGGAVAEDFDGDGRVDLLTSTWDTKGPLRLHLNRGEQGFVEQTAEAGLDGLFGGLNLVQADYDDDGDVDVLVLRGAWLPGGQGGHPNSLLENDGHGRFTDVTFAVGLGDHDHPTQTAAWADYDLDGDLDLYVGNESSNGRDDPSQLLRNDGGTFVDVAEEAGVLNRRYTKGVTWGDYDGDRYPDLYVSNLLTKNRLYRNLGDGTFEDVAEELGVEGPVDSFATWFWDFDNDGRLDLYVASYPQGSMSGNHGTHRLVPTVASVLGLPTTAEPAALYRGLPGGGFEECAEKMGLGQVSLTMGANFGDLDNDGFLDFYLGTGYPNYDGLVPNVMYRNLAGTGFANVTSAGGFGHLQKGHGIVFVDYDGDGDQDVFEQMGGAYRGDAYANVLYRNPGTANHWVRIELVGERSNRLGMGVRLRIDVAEGDELRSIHRIAGASGSFGGNPLDTHVGLGRAQRIVALEVSWPVTGERQVFRDLEVDRPWRIHEGRGEAEPVAPAH